MSTSSFQHKSLVRDSELDIQGIVNNAFYFVYMEHCRHLHCKSLGLDFAELHFEGFDLVLHKCKLHFKDSLRSGDEYIVTSEMSMKSKIRIIVEQSVIRVRDKKVVTLGNFLVASLNNKTGQVEMPAKVLGLF